MKIVGYAYNKTYHCPACTEQALEDKLLQHWAPESPSPHLARACRDEHGFPFDLSDNKGRLVQPMFAMQEEDWEKAVCDDCFKELNPK